MQLWEHWQDLCSKKTPKKHEQEPPEQRHLRERWLSWAANINAYTVNMPGESNISLSSVNNFETNWAAINREAETKRTCQERYNYSHCLAPGQCEQRRDRKRQSEQARTEHIYKQCQYHTWSFKKGYSCLSTARPRMQLFTTPDTSSWATCPGEVCFLACGG